MTKPSIIYFGNEQLAQGLNGPITPILDMLIAQEYSIKAIFTNYNPHQKSRSKTVPRVVELAERHNIPIYTPNSKKALFEALKPLILNSKETPIGVLAAYNIIIPDEALQLFEPIGILNLHPSLLPKYRGSTPIESVILNGDKETGISIMKLDKAMDAGPLYAQIKLRIPENISKQSLYEMLANTGSSTLEDILPSIHSLTPKAQSGTPTFTNKLTKSLSALKPLEKTAEELSREIRAFKNFPKSKLTLLNTPCTITSAHVDTYPKTPLDPKCKDQNFLIIDSLIPENSKEMTAEAFLNGHSK